MNDTRQLRYGIELITPRHMIPNATEDLRRLRQYRRRWKNEGLS